jgi:hypothetical protein
VSADPQEPIDCRSPEGKTEGLVDAVIALVWLLAERDLSPRNVQHALADLFQSPEIAAIQAAMKPLD